MNINRARGEARTVKQPWEVLGVGRGLRGSDSGQAGRVHSTVTVEPHPAPPATQQVADVITYQPFDHIY